MTRILTRLKRLLGTAPRQHRAEDAPAQPPPQQQPPRPTRTFDEYFRLIKGLGFHAATVLDVGAARGTPALHTAFPDAYFYLFEPLDDFIPQLEEILGNYRGELHQCALMAAPEVDDKFILRTKDLYGSSLMHRRAHEEAPNLQKVEIKTLDRVLAGRDLETPVLLKTDCQGADFEVIRGATQTLSQCDVVIMEVSFFRFWGDHHPDALAIFSYMDEQGFVIHDFLDGLFRPHDGALGQIDIAFVKKDGIFKRSHGWN